MTKVKIHIEGGGDSSRGRHPLRLAFGEFLGGFSSNDGKILKPKPIAWGPRNNAFNKFMDAIEDDLESIHILLVDSEDPVTTNPINHLQSRDGWRFIGVKPEDVHLMTQAMEAWLIADKDALEQYYGQHFNPRQLPRRQNVEEIPKDELKRTLRHASHYTSKGEYHEIKHASDILKLLDRQKVKDCATHCDSLFSRLEQIFADI